MATWRALAAIVLVAVGTLVAAVGPAVLVDAMAVGVGHLDIVLLALAVVVFVSLAAPKGTLKAPAAIASVGLLILAARHGLLTGRNVRVVVGIGLAGLGAWVILRQSARSRDWTDPAQRLTATLFGRALRVPAGSVAPRYMTVTAIGGTAVIDLRDSAWPGEALSVEVAINCIAGRVEVLLPAGWVSAAGRVHLSWGIHFGGSLDLGEPVRHVEELSGEAAKHLGHVVVLHVVGLAGVVNVPDRPKVQPGVAVETLPSPGSLPEPSASGPAPGAEDAPPRADPISGP